MKLSLHNIFEKSLLKENNSNSLFNNKTNVSYYDGALEKDLYYFVQKNIRGSIIEMPVDKYMAKCAKLQNTTFQQQFDFVRQDNVDKIKESMSKGIKYDLPYLYERVDGRGEQEGRHRAMASKQLGEEVIPVAYFREVSNEDLRKYALSLKGKSDDEAKQKLSKLGFKDLSMYNMVKGRLNYLMG